MNKAMSLVTAALLIFLMALGEPAAASDNTLSSSPTLNRILTKKELVVGTAASMPPLNMKTKDGRIIGMEMDLAQDFAMAMEVKLNVKPMAFKDLLPALESGQVDMVLSAMTMTPSRNLRVAFVGPYFASGKSLLTKTGNIDSVNTLEKMNAPEKILVALKGSTSQSFVENLIPKAKLVLVDDYDQAVAMVRNNKALAMIGDYPVCAVSIVRYPEAQFGMPDKPLTYEPIGVALPPNDLLLENWVQNFLNSLERIGGLKRLEERWLKDGSWITQLP
ncbi:MAG TPA: transporter substrate-binding domain-containing protein [Thermodesulfobacteriota bacterium]|nr:transporter substrate-binding domain-containing protein [Thermodesulfobacteriota bacterium]